MMLIYFNISFLRVVLKKDFVALNLCFLSIALFMNYVIENLKNILWQKYVFNWFDKGCTMRERYLWDKLEPVLLKGFL